MISHSKPMNHLTQRSHINVKYEEEQNYEASRKVRSTGWISLLLSALTGTGPRERGTTTVHCCLPLVISAQKDTMIDDVEHH